MLPVEGVFIGHDMAEDRSSAAYQEIVNDLSEVVPGGDSACIARNNTATVIEVVERSFAIVLITPEPSVARVLTGDHEGVDEELFVMRGLGSVQGVLLQEGSLPKVERA